MSYIQENTVSHQIFQKLILEVNLDVTLAWLNDNSSGPEWVLVEIEKPEMKLFTKKNEPSSELNHSIERVKSWDRYFKENPLEKKRIFGAVSNFRFIMVGGKKEDWQTEDGIKWLAYHNETRPIEIRSSDVFLRPLQVVKEKFEELWSFEENPKSLKHSELEKFWIEYGFVEKGIMNNKNEMPTSFNSK